jgi:hypothetical protein
MRKRIVEPATSVTAADNGDWLHLEQLAEVEVTSEDSNAPIEGVFSLHHPTGWRAATAGDQTIRLVFDAPQQVRRIEVLFVEDTRERAQEFVLRYGSEAAPLREIVRQQFHFSPGGAVRELESFSVSLTNVCVLELHIIPDRGGGDAVATLAQMRVA